MHPDLKTLDHVDDLHRLIDESRSRPLLLFKHSYSCGTSLEALEELIAHLHDRDREADVPEPQYAMVTVQTHREVSNAVAKQLGVRHETPQALLVRDGRVVWSASHVSVTASAVETALKVNAARKGNGALKSQS